MYSEISRQNASIINVKFSQTSIPKMSQDGVAEGEPRYVSQDNVGLFFCGSSQILVKCECHLLARKIIKQKRCRVMFFANAQGLLWAF